jgi:hypothetical protein
VREEREEFLNDRADYSWSKRYKKQIEDEYKEFVRSLQTILRSIIGEGLITNKKLIEQIESEMSSGLFSRGGVAA